MYTFATHVRTRHTYQQLRPVQAQHLQHLRRAADLGLRQVDGGDAAFADLLEQP